MVVALHAAAACVVDDESLFRRSRVEFRSQEYLNMESLVAPLGEAEADAVLQISAFQPIADIGRNSGA